MNSIVVYHGSTEIVENPNCLAGRKNLDFGRGFYVTFSNAPAQQPDLHPQSGNNR